MASPFGNPDAGLSGAELNMRCAFEKVTPCTHDKRCNGEIHARDHDYTHIDFCDVPYEDHNDDKLGHAFVEPEPEGRDY